MGNTIASIAGMVVVGRNDSYPSSSISRNYIGCHYHWQPRG